MNPIFPFLFLLASWSIDSTDPAVQQGVNYIFIVVHGVLFLVMFYLFTRIWMANETRTLQVKDTYTNELQKMSVGDYDFSKWRELLFTKLLLPVAIGFFIASKWNTPFPLLLQCVRNPFLVFHCPLFQLHILHYPEDKKLVRPWKEESVMPEWMQQLWQKSQAGEEPSISGSPNLKNKRRKS